MGMESNLRRFMGHFFIDIDFISGDGISPEDKAKVMDDIFVLDVKTSVVTNTMEFWACSPKHFRELKDGDMIPTYECLISKNEDDSINFSWREFNQNGN
jgi:hypothetical protein